MTVYEMQLKLDEALGRYQWSLGMYLSPRMDGNRWYVRGVPGHRSHSAMPRGRTIEEALAAAVECLP